MLGARAVIHAQPRRPFPSKGPREAKGGGLPDRHRGNLCVAAGRRCWGACGPWRDQRTDTMPTNKDFKRLVRARMQKTGESYTAARAHLITKKQAQTPDYAKLAGMMSDAALKVKTRCTWERWVKALDRVQAHTWPHRRIATYVQDKYKLPSWWSQTVTVGYGGCAARGAGKSQVALQHRKLADKAAAVRMKEYWGVRLGALGEVLA